MVILLGLALILAIILLAGMGAGVGVVLLRVIQHQQRELSMMAERLAHPPVIRERPAPPGPDVVSIVKAVAELFNGPRSSTPETPEEFQRRVQAMSMGDLGLNDEFGVTEPPLLPTEDDPWMEQFEEMERQTANGTSPIARTGSGPMFRPGQGGSPPDGGIET